MPDNVITLVGNLTDDPDLRYTPAGVAVANLRIAVNRRFRNQQTNEWEDRLDGYFTVNVWRDMAENVSQSLRRGTRVIVQGRLISRSYETKEGETRWVTEIEADEVCPSLRWATAEVTRTSGGSRGGGNANTGGDTSWGGAPAPQAPATDDVPF